MDLNYLPSQQLVFFPTEFNKFTIVTKGRRVGLTRGAAQAFIEWSMGGRPLKLLWGETIYSNVQRYIDLYFVPLLEQLPKGTWAWRSKLMQLEIYKTIIDFRSADSPETWEGFGYHVIFLNEAGIILRDPNLYKKTVLPMLMDYPDARLIAAGVPKGKKLKDGTAHPFFELWEKAANTPNYVRYNFPTRTNKFLRQEDIDEVEAALDSKIRLQEIEGQFIDITDNPYFYAFNPEQHIINKYEPLPNVPLWFSFDFNIEPNSCIIGQQPDHTSGRTFDRVSVNGATTEVCNVLISKYGHWIRRGLVFVTGDATGKNRNAMSGETTNYIIIKKALGLRDYNFKVRQVNMELKASRVLCNSILDKGDVAITEDCKDVITDCQLASVDGAGDLIKEGGLHKFDCQRYLWGAWFPDFLEKPHKYMRQGKLPRASKIEAAVNEKEKIKPKG